MRIREAAQKWGLEKTASRPENRCAWLPAALRVEHEVVASATPKARSIVRCAGFRFRVLASGLGVMVSGLGFRFILFFRWFWHCSKWSHDDGAAHSRPMTIIRGISSIRRRPRYPAAHQLQSACKAFRRRGAWELWRRGRRARGISISTLAKHDNILIIRIGFWSQVYYTYKQEPQK